jgi:hypothetical protein
MFYDVTSTLSKACFNETISTNAYQNCDLQSLCSVSSILCLCTSRRVSRLLINAAFNFNDWAKVLPSQERGEGMRGTARYGMQSRQIEAVWWRPLRGTDHETISHPPSNVLFMQSNTHCSYTVCIFPNFKALCPMPWYIAEKKKTKGRQKDATELPGDPVFDAAKKTVNCEHARSKMKT